ncbi:MAG: hypothetical protein PHF37_03345 [Phycisphaerae bacterium]|nr:hypothetical protein [Phycisphaerae bacterium]
MKVVFMQIISEIDVLCATFDFLMERNVSPYQFSPINGDTNCAKIYGRVADWITKEKDIRPINFSRSGPDIIGVSENEWWQIECKGSGSGKTQTQRNNFDRALASVVSYYCDNLINLPARYTKFNRAVPYLGLALPASQDYLNELRNRVRQPLRKKLNLWVLLYGPESKKIKAVSPEDNY